jgi:hypothetical protein
MRDNRVDGVVSTLTFCATDEMLEVLGLRCAFLKYSKYRGCDGNADGQNG